MLDIIFLLEQKKKRKKDILLKRKLTTSRLPPKIADSKYPKIYNFIIKVLTNHNLTSTFRRSPLSDHLHSLNKLQTQFYTLSPLSSPPVATAGIPRNPSHQWSLPASISYSSSQVVNLILLSSFSV